MQNEKQAEELGVTAEVTVIASWAVFVMGRPEAAGLLKESVFAAGLLPHHYQCAIAVAESQKVWRWFSSTEHPEVNPDVF